MHSTTAASAFHAQFLQHCCWRSDTHYIQFLLSGIEFARILRSGISKHGWKYRFLSSSAVGQVFRMSPKEDERKLRNYSTNVYVTRDDSKSLPLRYFLFVIHTFIQWHSTWYSLWVMQINTVECLKWKQRSSDNTMIPGPAMSQYHEIPNKTESRRKSNTGGYWSSSIFIQGQKKSFRTTLWQLRLQQ